MLMICVLCVVVCCCVLLCGVVCCCLGLCSYPKLDGRFPHVSGVRLIFDPKQPAKSRVVEVVVVDIDGKESKLELNKKVLQLQRLLKHNNTRLCYIQYTNTNTIKSSK